MRKNKKAFTLIELIAVLVILAIIALIVTPLVMNIVKKAKDSANKRSVDAYGKAVELGVATYLLDNGDYPTDISSLTIEYSGSEVVCTTKKLNEDGSIYLSGCSVNGVEVKDSKNEDGYYHYGKTSADAYQLYNVGDVVTYNGMNFYVIENSDESKDSVTLLKDEPLSYEETQNYVVETGIQIYNHNGYGGMPFGATSDYESSYVKVVVDAWTNSKLNLSDLKEDSLGYKTRLLSIEDLTNNLGYVGSSGESYMSFNSENTPSWICGNGYWYWTMSAYEDSTSRVWSIIGSSGDVDDNDLNFHGLDVVRPVITLSKSAI